MHRHPSRSFPAAGRPCRPNRGFTLIELIMVIVILGVLAVFAAPRMFNSGDAYARGFYDETLAYLRYAQKTAIAQRRTVCITFPSTSSLVMNIASADGTPDCSAAAVGGLVGPKGDNASATLNAKGGVVYSSLPLGLNFNGLGQPTTSAGAVLSSARTMQVAGLPGTITVEASTGYVHD